MLFAKHPAESSTNISSRRKTIVKDTYLPKIPRYISNNFVRFNYPFTSGSQGISSYPRQQSKFLAQKSQFWNNSFDLKEVSAAIMILLLASSYPFATGTPHKDCSCQKVLRKQIHQLVCAVYPSVI